MEKAEPTRRIALRPLKSADVVDLQRWMNEPEVFKFMARPKNITNEDAEAWMRELRKPPHLGLGIVLMPENFLIGIATLHDINRYHGTASTGTIVGNPQHWRRGYATEAKQRILDIAFNKLGLSVVESTVMGDDAPGMAFVKSCGYEEAGRVRDWYRKSDGKRSDKVIFYLNKGKWAQMPAT